MHFMDIKPFKLRVKYPFIGTKLKAKSRKQKNYLPPVIPNLIGNPRFKLLKSKNRTFVAVQTVDSRFRGNDEVVSFWL